MITLFGATGFTGQIIANGLDLAGMRFRIAGRSSRKLQELSSTLSSRPECIFADASQVSTLPALFRNSRLLINCTGPFTDLGERVISQAAMSGSSYIDISNELGYLFRIRGYHEMARKTGSLLLPACGFEVALTDCAAQICADRLLQANNNKPLQCIDVIYQINGASSAGTRRSAIRSLATSWMAYQKGEWIGAMPADQRRKFDLNAGKAKTFSIPSSESVTIPRHINVDQVNVWMATGSTGLIWSIPLLARLSRSILRPVIMKLAARSSRASRYRMDDGQITGAGFLIHVICTNDSGKTWMTLTGKNPYGLTGKIIVYTAQRILDSASISGGGLFAPSQILDPSSFLTMAQKDWCITITEGTG